MQQLKFAIRNIRRSPGFSAAVVCVLALGIGSNAMIFSAIQSVLLNPVPFRLLREPDRLVMLWERNPSLTVFFAERMPPRLASFRAWKEQAKSFEDLAVWRLVELTLTANDDRHGLKPEQVEGGYASSNFFPLLGVRLQLGRNFSDEEMQAGRGDVVILSDELFRGRFGADPAILGRQVTAGGKAYRVIGVLPAGFQMPAYWQGFDQKKPKMWLPIDLHPSEQQDNEFSSFVFARLKPGVAVAEARSEMAVVSKRLTDAFPDKYTSFSSNVSPLREENTGPEMRRALVVLQVAVAFVLLIACANVGNLLLTRSLEREMEAAVRTALGASRWDIVRQRLTECAILSVLATAAGVGLAIWALTLFAKFAPTDANDLRQIEMDASALAGTVGVSIVATFLFALIPAAHAWRSNVNGVLSRTGRGTSGATNRVRNVLAIAEIGLSLVLLAGAGLMIRTLTSLMNTDLGFRVDHLLVMRVELPELRYRNPEVAASFNRRLLEAIRQTPGVVNAALTNALPLKSVHQSSFEFPGIPNTPGNTRVANWARASDGYFETLGVRVIRGRTFTREEVLAAEPREAVVNEAFARSFFRGQETIGKRIVFNNEAGRRTVYTIVGIVANERQLGPEGEQSPQFYLPGNQLRSIIIFARTEGDPLAMANAVKQQVWNLDKDQPTTEVETAEVLLRNWTAQRRFNMAVLVSFAVIALALAAVGLYSVLAYSVTLRRREIGIRMALGAEPGRVARFVLRQGVAMALIGIGAGLAGALVLTRFMQKLIFGVSATDPVTFAAVAGVLVLISGIASYLPAARAARVNPIEALRAE